MPHFLAIAWLFRDDYAAAGIPLLPSFSPMADNSASGSALHGRTDSSQLSADGRRSCERLLSRRRDGVGGRADRVESRIRRHAEAGGQRLFFGTILYLPLLWAVLLVDHYTYIM